MSKKDFMKIMGEIDDEILERFDKVERKFTVAAARRKVTRTVTLIAACVVVAASLVAVPALISSADDTPPEQTGTSTTTTTKKTSKSTTTGRSEPNPVFFELRDPYAIIRISELTDETINYYGDRSEPYKMVKAKCEVLHTHCVDGLSHYPEYEPEKFENVVDIYLEESTATEMSLYDMVMIGVKLYILNDECYYIPYMNEEVGKSEYLPFVDGKIVIDTLSSISFSSLEEINKTIESLKKRPESSGALAELPKEKFENGMTYEQVTSFLDACKRVLEIRDNLAPR